MAAIAHRDKKIFMEAGKSRVLEREKKAIIECLSEESCAFEAKLKKYELKEPKCAEESRKIRAKATAHLATRERHSAQVHEQLWRQCCESVAKAPGDLEEMALALNDRSRLMFHLRKYGESIKDIERALQITHMSGLKVELHCRKIECYVAMGVDVDKVTYEKAKLYLSKVHEADESRPKLIDAVRKAKLSMERGEADAQAKDAREKIGTTTSSVRVCYSEKYGRHLVATRDIKPGDVVCVERFYTVTRNPSEPYAYCSQCLNISWTLVPCSQCDLSMYCSENCKAKSWDKCHDVECAIAVPIMQFCPDFDYCCRLALKFLIMALKETGSIKKLRFELEEIEDCKDPCSRGMTDGKFRSNTFRSVYSLSHPFQFEKLKYLTEKSVVALIAIAKYSKLLGNKFTFVDAKELATNKDAVFLGALLLKFSLIAHANAIDFLENYTDVIVNNGKAHLKRMAAASRGQAIAPLTSLINHNCNPNVNKLYTDDARVVYYCILPIKKDSQIFDSYCPPFYSTWSKLERHKFLAEFYQLRCKCEACHKNWTSAPAQHDNRTEHLELQPHDISQDSVTKTIFKKVSKYIRIITKSQDISTKMLAFKSIGDDIDILLKNLGFPSSQVTVFFYLLRLAYEKTYGCSRVVIPDGNNCRYK